MKFRYVIMSMLLMCAAAAPAMSQSVQERRAELKKQFEARYPELSKLRDQGKVGETYDGQVLAVDAAFVNKSEQNLIKQENSDREKLYNLIANEVIPEDRKVPESVVAQRNGKRNFEKAAPDAYLMVKEGFWIQKKDLNRYEELSRLKKEGKIGETAGGYVEAVKSADASEPDVKNVIAAENNHRQRLYERIAKAREKTSAEAVAMEHGREILQHVNAGEYYKSGSAWQQKPESKS